MVTIQQLPLTDSPTEIPGISGSDADQVQVATREWAQQLTQFISVLNTSVQKLQQTTPTPTPTPTPSPSSGSDGTDGTDGLNGWTPMLSLVPYNGGMILKVIGWTGGEGTPPVSGVYIGATGFVTAMVLALNVQGAAGSSAGVVVTNMAELRATTTTVDQTVFFIQGHTTVSDGGEGTFILDASDTTSTDNDGITVVNAGGSRIKRQGVILAGANPPAWSSTGVYTVGFITKDSGVTYECSANVGPSSTHPASDGAHWAAVASTAAEQASTTVNVAWWGISYAGAGNAVDIGPKLDAAANAIFVLTSSTAGCIEIPAGRFLLKRWSRNLNNGGTAFDFCLKGAGRDVTVLDCKLGGGTANALELYGGGTVTISNIGFSAAIGYTAPTDSYVYVRDSSYVCFEMLSGKNLQGTFIHAHQGSGSGGFTVFGCISNCIGTQLHLDGGAFIVIANSLQNGDGSAPAVQVDNCNSAKFTGSIFGGGGPYTSNVGSAISSSSGTEFVIDTGGPHGFYSGDYITLRNSTNPSLNTWWQIAAVGGGAIAGAMLSGSGVGSVVVSNGGAGYYNVPTVALVGGGGTGATATAVISGGIVTGITVTNAGTGYTMAPAVVITVSSTYITITSTLNPGIIGVDLYSLISCVHFGSHGGNCTESSITNCLFNTNGITTGPGSVGLHMDGYIGSIGQFQISDCLSDFGWCGFFVHGLSHVVANVSYYFPASLISASTATNFTVTTEIVGGTPVAHGLTAGDYIYIGQATPTGYSGAWLIASVPTASTLTVNSTANLGTGTAQVNGGIPGASIGSIAISNCTAYPADTFGGFRLEGCFGVSLTGCICAPGSSAAPTGTYYSLVMNDGGAGAKQAIKDQVSGSVSGPTSSIKVTGGTYMDDGRRGLFFGASFYPIVFDGSFVTKVSCMNVGVDGATTPGLYRNGATNANALTVMYADPAGNVVLESVSGIHNL